TGSYDGTIRAWDVASGEQRALVHDHGWGINVVLAVGEDLVFGGLDGTLARLPRVGGEVQVLAKRDHPVLSLALSPDGTRLAAGFGDGHILVLETAGWVALEEHINPYG